MGSADHIQHATLVQAQLQIVTEWRINNHLHDPFRLKTARRAGGQEHKGTKHAGGQLT